MAACSNQSEADGIRSRILWSLLKSLEQNLLVLFQTQIWVLDIDDGENF